MVCLLTVGSVFGVLTSGGPVQLLSRLVRTALLGCLSALLITVSVLLHVLHAFTGETLVARVTTSRTAPDAFELVYQPATGEPARRVQLRGDQWAISGGIVAWHPWLTGLGVPSYHRPTRLSGQYADIKRQRAQAPTLAALEPAVDRVWESFYHLEPYLPFVGSVYGSSAYVYVEPDKIQEVYVTPTGYRIKRHPK